jgi:hypothetical protein
LLIIIIRSFKLKFINDCCCFVFGNLRHDEGLFEELVRRRVILDLLYGHIGVVVCATVHSSKLAHADLSAHVDGRLVDPQAIQQGLVVARRGLPPPLRVLDRIGEQTGKVVVQRVEVNELDQIAEEVLVVDGEPLVHLLDVVVLDLAVRFEAQGEVAGIVCALAHLIRALR